MSKRKWDEYFSTVEGKHECKKCIKKFAIQGQGGTSTRKNHFESCWTKADVHSQQKGNRQPTLPEMGQTSMSALLNELCVRFVADNDLPFAIVKKESFKAIVRFGCSSSVKIPDKRLLGNKLLENVAEKFKIKLTRNVDQNLPVAIQFDEYSNKRVRLITVTMTQISKKFQIRTYRLGVKSLDSDRANAENLKHLVSAILAEYGIKNVVGVTRDGALNALCEKLGYSSVHCINHILNLAVQDGYNGLDKRIDGIKSCVSRMHASKLSMNILESECNAVGTLHLFTRIRWNSFARTLRSFLKNYDALRRFEISRAATNLKTTVNIPHFNRIELHEFTDFADCLAALEELTKLAESRECPCSTIFYIRHRIQKIVERGKESENKLVHNFISGFEQKWMKYSDSLTENELIRYAAFFDPRIISRYLSKEEWLKIRDEILEQAPDEILNEENAVESTVSNWDDDDEQPQNEESSSFKTQVIEYWDSKKLNPISKKDGIIETRLDELLIFWRTKEHVWPELTALARKYLTVTASSSEPERVFSHITHLLSNPRRNRLKPEKIEKLVKVREYLALEKMNENSKNDDDEFSDDEELSDNENEIDIDEEFYDHENENPHVGDERQLSNVGEKNYFDD